MNSDTIYRQAAVKHLKHRLYETAMNNDDLAGVFSEIADNRIETWIEEVPSADPDVITMRVDIDKEAWKQALASSPLTVFPDEEPDTGLYVDGFDDGFKAGAQRWIPVTERLPETPSFCLVTTDGSHNDVIDIALYMSDGWHKASKILAWMPLPEPYREEEDETD